MLQISDFARVHRNAITKILILTGILIFVLGGWSWWQKVYKSPSRVFWGMIDSSLSTSSVTRRVDQGEGGQTLEQLIHLRTGSQNAARVLETTKRGDGTQSSTVVRETIGTPDTDFIRYVVIDIPPQGLNATAVDYSNIEGLWGRSEESGDGSRPQVQYFNQALLGTVPFANLSPAQRNKLVDLIRDKKVFEPSYETLQRTKENGRQVYIYDVQINPLAYFEMLEAFVKEIGLGEIPGLDPAAYEGLDALKAQFTVSVLSRQLTKIHYVNSGQDEIYQDYGLIMPIGLPETTIPTSELQNRIQNVQ